MVRAGLAWHFKRCQGEQTEDERATYTDAEEEAKAVRRGLWSQVGAMAPWECRSAMREGTSCR
jgi:endonuclease YncB( thermonuclease family)